MSSLFTRAFDPSRLSALAAASTIMGTWGSVPDLPLRSCDIELPTHSVVLPTMPAIIRPRPRVVDETRELALALSRDQGRLQGWDRTFVREVVKWRAEPSAFEADEMAALAERHYWHIQDELRGRL